MALEVETEYRKAPPRCLLVLLVLFPKEGRRLGDVECECGVAHGAWHFRYIQFQDVNVCGCTPASIVIDGKMRLVLVARDMDL